METSLQDSQKRFELENQIKLNDEFFKHDKNEQKEILKLSPWKEE